MSLSLESAHYLVLLALAGEEMNGLQVQRQIVADTVGVYVPVATVYEVLKSLGRRELVKVRRSGHITFDEITVEGRRILELAAKDKRDTSRQAQKRLGYH